MKNWQGNLTLSEYHTAYSIVTWQFYFGINELSPSVDSGWGLSRLLFQINFEWYILYLFLYLYSFRYWMINYNYTPHFKSILF